MNKFAAENFEGIPEYSAAMYRFITEVLKKQMPIHLLPENACHSSVPKNPRHYALNCGDAGFLSLIYLGSSVILARIYFQHNLNMLTLVLYTECFCGLVYGI